MAATAGNRFDVRGTIFDVSGRVALVTGSSRGLGAAMAAALAAAGATVVLNARADGALQDTRDRIAAGTGARVEAVAFDVCDEPAVDAAVEQVEAEVGPVDILVNNAGVNHRVPMLDLELADWNRVLAANLTGPFLVGRAVARGMVGRGRGKIVNIASLMSRLARPTVAPYAASKGGWPSPCPPPRTGLRWRCCATGPSPTPCCVSGGVDRIEAGQVLRDLQGQGLALREGGRRYAQYVLDPVALSGRPTLAPTTQPPTDRSDVAGAGPVSTELALSTAMSATASELVQATGLTRPTVVRHLNELIARGSVVAEGAPRSRKRRYRWVGPPTGEARDSRTE